ncbi:PREDICTED: GDSL esterase/lipase At5g03980-like [Nelumbo nucifera]|uniref:GDSL esterase/lipase At5g03980-like n=1 Tax=Nelumbo nucifera TaxID=4432 RepID=A0A1U8Q1Q4_NELNU|nr:PREDICTED: GDSL esterase/lipase At5g03980-like [Nelumbo nucifera]
MASAFYMFTLILLLLLLPFTTSAQHTICPFEAIYQLGDSISDTGNLIREGPAGAMSYAARFPYGETFFHRPTGRCSNGLLIIDYIAMALRLALVNPYLERGVSFDHGVNFAVAGSTALDASFFSARNLHVPLSNSPLSTQLNWFRTHLNSLCHTDQTDCGNNNRLERALVLVGEIGGNDYNYAFFQGKPIEEIRTYVPYVVGAITNAVREVIGMGGIRIVVPGNFPIGCIPIYLTSFRNNDPRAYDDMGCLSGLNDFAMLHNNYLQRALDGLRRDYPNVVILYADYYTAFQSVLRFVASSLLKACCGIGGEYNFDGSRMCGSPGVPVCPNPANRIHWDGVHLTQEAYRHMADWLTGDILSRIQCVW